ncbi:2TM domain-containing protein [Leeuwenhoekiella parthenopeia]|uniref:2TM domain-containing protein n=1 Tax=Leeuwenhoekiella parthenopeia TaxID=2890320 RepID=A0ABS8GRS4_9FLAO|nr:2TM domain-containing protein [Leeuwenhoekiella parthenopeia]MCC4211957.1 2TM domain-containing protein [Leeuwenhoekiella parthenopeia]
MFSKKQESSKIDPEQRELIEYAQKRVKQKKNLFRHFIVFLAGGVLFIILNKFLDFGSAFRPASVDWFVWAVLIWFFLFLIHALNVFLLNSFMTKKWENEQLDKLVAKQKAKIAKLQTKVENDHPLPKSNPGITSATDRPFNS